jgi:prevent-host-death family protein
MRAISAREFGHDVRKYLEDVAAGESIEITDQGRPIARLVVSADHARGVLAHSISMQRFR